MAKNFNQKQKEIVARKLGYDGPMQGFDEFLRSDPALQARYGAVLDKYMARGGLAKKNKKKYAVGGFANNTRMSTQIDGTAGESYDAATAEAPAEDRASGLFKMYATGFDADQAAIDFWNNKIATQGYDAALNEFLNPAQGSAAPRFQAMSRDPDYLAATGRTQQTGTGTQDQQQQQQQQQQDTADARTQVQDQWGRSPNDADYGLDPVARQLFDYYVTGSTPSRADLEFWSNKIKTLGYEGALNAFLNPEDPNAPRKKIMEQDPDYLRVNTGAGTVTGGGGGGGGGGGSSTVTVTGPGQPTTPTMTTTQIPFNANQLVTAPVVPPAAQMATPQNVNAVMAGAPGPAGAQMYLAAQAQPAVSSMLGNVQAQQGTVSRQSQVQAQSMDPRQTALMDIQAAQGLAQQVNAPLDRELQAGELVSGPAVEQARINETLAQAQAAQGEVTPEMTLQGQLGKMLADFDAGNPPTWAAATLRAATAQLAARGLGASSLAGQAVVQAALEAATPIAAADAQVFQQMGLQNLSNRQQMAVLTAQQRAQFLGQEFDQAFQTKVLNAAKIADIANMNFSADVQIAMENARLAQTMNLANLSNQQATIMAKAAQIANLESQNLSNRQQAAIVNAQAFLQMDMANLSNRQQTELFKAQEMSQAILSDTASQNAARQFNATSQMQVDQFNASMIAQVNQFNASQANGIAQFNSGQLTAVNQFNTAAINARDQFNAQNALIIAQSNAEWRRQLSTANTAAQNVANQFNAQAALQLTTTSYSNQWQTYRDMLQYSHTAAQNDLDRENRLALQTLQAEAARYAADREIKSSMYKALGSLGASILSGAGGGGLIGKFVDGVSNAAVASINAISKFLGGNTTDYNVTEIFPPNAEFGVRYFDNGYSFDTNTNTYYDANGNIQWQPLDDELIEFDTNFEDTGDGGEG